jgi:hypothetical protein
MDFEAFPKIPRLRHLEVCITEKIDGTNAQVCVTAEGEIFAGKRTSWCTPEADNFGFAAWVQANKEELAKLGPGRHFGEWYGAGIQRRYGLEEKRFALFNTVRWGQNPNRPACCGVVPVLYAGAFTATIVNDTLEALRASGSVLVPGWMKPEGIVVFFSGARSLHKVLLENDDIPKGKVA